MENISAVVFDLYNTLIYSSKKTWAYRKLFSDIGLNDVESKKARDIVLTETFETLNLLVERLNCDVSINERKYLDLISEEITSVKLYSDVAYVLTELKEKQIKLGLISNLSSPFKKTFFDLGLDDYFDKTIFSCDVGFKKPDKDIYELMLHELKLSPNKILMIGDSVRCDVLGPKVVGMDSLHLDREKKSSDSLHSLYELLNCI